MRPTATFSFVTFFVMVIIGHDETKTAASKESLTEKTYQHFVYAFNGTEAAKITGTSWTRKFPAIDLTTVDKNKDGEVSANEMYQLAAEKKVEFSLSREQAVRFLLYLYDDGYVVESKGIQFTPEAVKILDGYGKAKYASVNSELTRHPGSGKIVGTGSCAVDGKLSISELANAIADKKLLVSDKFILVSE